MKATSLPPWAFWLSCGRIRGADRLESAAGQIAAAGGQPRTALKVLDGLVVRIVDADFRLAPVDPAGGRPPVGGRDKVSAGQLEADEGLAPILALQGDPRVGQKPLFLVPPVAVDIKRQDHVGTAFAASLARHERYIPGGR